MENKDFFYVPDELDNKGDVKRLIVGILCVGLLFFIAYVLISYVGEFPITAYLSLYAVIWIGTTIFLLGKFFSNRAELRPELVLELIKNCSDTPKLKDTILNIIKVQEKITKSDLFRILYVLQKELSELYVKNYRDLVGIEKDQEAEIIAKGEAEIESYTKSIAVLENTLQNMELREERGG
ncbi:hypothetical protein N5J44_16280 [Acinetobacter ursingii]|uniref:hypothetical protein n=1 Tax=Acinetobacter ursingii TaxID=108980 RepID=UPI00244702C0|nr:hypothetical protein [Acinetobacter ursingii]MDH2020734.1 hypothetical protein [Acinetobacter ursingii]MDH2073063.1 hypothetical protein [Acinetobacter ursingii]